MHGLVADQDRVVLGIVHFVYHRSTWTLGPYCYLQDLFTAEAARGRGVGKALIEAVYTQARADGASRVYWLTHESNEVARSMTSSRPGLASSSIDSFSEAEGSARPRETAPRYSHGADIERTDRAARWGTSRECRRCKGLGTQWQA
jgi:hypothetical protein